MDAPHVDAVGLINELHERWRKMQRLTGREIAARYRALLSRIDRE
jgi:hypothetical protein